MPLLLCPNDNAAMSTVTRNGIEFDMCPTCRGVWLDRGELEKLIEAGSGPGAPPLAPASPPPHYSDRNDRHGRDDRYDRDDGYRKKKRRDIFDIFD
ncbi:zf-TFIIB domain-containing protein [Brevundimonas sp. TWP1-2-1b1]|uniref:TFIIB-type zinc ribbon-containing protein n=1 Tax=unclassified Brevundimonas TaxID=2622653 RepID=UPI003CFB9653